MTDFRSNSRREHPSKTPPCRIGQSSGNGSNPSWKNPFGSHPLRNKLSRFVTGNNFQKVLRGYGQGILKGGSITVPLTSCLTGLESAVLQLKFLFLFAKQTCLSQSNRGRDFIFRSGHLHAAIFLVLSVKLPNLQLKTRPKQLLGSLPTVISLPGLHLFPR
jgi:hypothetical protein